MTNRSKAPDNPAAEMGKTPIPVAELNRLNQRDTGDEQPRDLVLETAKAMGPRPMHEESERLKRDNAKPRRRLDSAMSALGKIERILEPLSSEERVRIIRWVAHEYHCQLERGLE